jgi:DNA-binding NtrC family response regulator
MPSTTTSSPHRFLVIDENPDGRFLLSKALLRAFPDAAVLECQVAETGFRVLRHEDVAAVIAHRTFEFDGVSLIRELRKIDAAVPIIMTSGIDREKLALEAGATAFFSYDQWLKIGMFVTELLARTPPPESAVLAK